MQQELIKRKREIIDTLLKKGILISSELLKEIDDDGQISKIFELLKSEQVNDTLVVGLELNKQSAKQKHKRQKHRKSKKEMLK